jgi:hypothetical protein
MVIKITDKELGLIKEALSFGNYEKVFILIDLFMKF